MNEPFVPDGPGAVPGGSPPAPPPPPAPSPTRNLDPALTPLAAPPPRPPDPSPPSAPPPAAIEARGLRYAFKSHQALADVSFRVEPRSLHGFVGPNGAGKTTTLKIIATLLRSQTGSIRVYGADVTRNTREVRRRIGYMPDHFGLYRQMTVAEYLDFFAAAYGLPLAKRDRILKDVLALTDMEGRKDDLVQSLSQGMQQRVGLARALINDPDLLLLDEPASGLDPRARIELMEILQEFKRMGKTVFISSHILTELATLCDSVTIIDRGQVRYSGTMRGLLRAGGEQARYELELAREHPPAEEALRRLPGVEEARREDGTLKILLAFRRSETDTGAILRAVLDAGGEVASFKELERHLNEAFMDLTTPGVS